MAPTPQLWKPAAVISRHYEIEAKIGEGTFSEIYRAKDLGSGELVAIKVEKDDNLVLRSEIKIHKALQDCDYVCRQITTGAHEDRTYLVMELLGENLTDLRRKHCNNRFSVGTTVKLGIQLLDAIKGMHELGFLHRDIKPANFVFGTGSKGRKCYIIDFGLARKYKMDNGEVYPPRERGDFRGSPNYASVNSHLRKDLGRRDDLWSLLYVLVEFLEGDLPWRQFSSDREKVQNMKAHFNKSPEKFGRRAPLPIELQSFVKYLRSLQFAEEPDYRYLRQLLESLAERAGHKGSWQSEFRYDWEAEEVKPKASSELRPATEAASAASGDFSGSTSRQLQSLAVPFFKAPSLLSNTSSTIPPSPALPPPPPPPPPLALKPLAVPAKPLSPPLDLPPSPIYDLPPAPPPPPPLMKLPPPPVPPPPPPFPGGGAGEGGYKSPQRGESPSSSGRDARKGSPGRRRWSKSPESGGRDRDDRRYRDWERERDKERQRERDREYDRDRKGYDRQDSWRRRDEREDRDREYDRREGSSRANGYGNRGRQERNNKKSLICYDMIVQQVCKKAKCEFFHPPSMPSGKATSLCLDDVSHHCPKTPSMCNRYHWTREEEEEYRRSGKVPKVGCLPPAKYNYKFHGRGDKGLRPEDFSPERRSYDRSRTRLRSRSKDRYEYDRDRRNRDPEREENRSSRRGEWRENEEDRKGDVYRRRESDELAKREEKESARNGDYKRAEEDTESSPAKGRKQTVEHVKESEEAKVVERMPPSDALKIIQDYDVSDQEEGAILLTDTVTESLDKHPLERSDRPENSIDRQEEAKVGLASEPKGQKNSCESSRKEERASHRASERERSVRDEGREADRQLEALNEKERIRAAERGFEWLRRERSMRSADRNEKDYESSRREGNSRPSSRSDRGYEKPKRQESLLRRERSRDADYDRPRREVSFVDIDKPAEPVPQLSSFESLADTGRPKEEQVKEEKASEPSVTRSDEGKDKPSSTGGNVEEGEKAEQPSVDWNQPVGWLAISTQVQKVQDTEPIREVEMEEEEGSAEAPVTEQTQAAEGPPLAPLAVPLLEVQSLPSPNSLPPTPMEVVPVAKGLADQATAGGVGKAEQQQGEITTSAKDTVRKTPLAVAVQEAVQEAKARASTPSAGRGGKAPNRGYNSNLSLQTNLKAPGSPNLGRSSTPGNAQGFGKDAHSPPLAVGSPMRPPLGLPLVRGNFMPPGIVPVRGLSPEGPPLPPGPPPQHLIGPSLAPPPFQGPQVRPPAAGPASPQGGTPAMWQGAPPPPPGPPPAGAVKVPPSMMYGPFFPAVGRKVDLMGQAGQLPQEPVASALWEQLRSMPEAASLPALEEFCKTGKAGDAPDAGKVLMTMLNRKQIEHALQAARAGAAVPSVQSPTFPGPAGFPASSPRPVDGSWTGQGWEYGWRPPEGGRFQTSPPGATPPAMHPMLGAPTVALPQPLIPPPPGVRPLLGVAMPTGEVVMQAGMPGFNGPMRGLPMPMVNVVGAMMPGSPLSRLNKLPSQELPKASGAADVAGPLSSPCALSPAGKKSSLPADKKQGEGGAKDGGPKLERRGSALQMLGGLDAYLRTEVSPSSYSRQHEKKAVVGKSKLKAEPATKPSLGKSGLGPKESSKVKFKDKLKSLSSLKGSKGDKKVVLKVPPKDAKGPQKEAPKETGLKHKEVVARLRNEPEEDEKPKKKAKRLVQVKDTKDKASPPLLKPSKKPGKGGGIVKPKGVPSKPPPEEKEEHASPRKAQAEAPVQSSPPGDKVEKSSDNEGGKLTKLSLRKEGNNWVKVGPKVGAVKADAKQKPVSLAVEGDEEGEPVEEGVLEADKTETAEESPTPSEKRRPGRAPRRKKGVASQVTSPLGRRVTRGTARGGEEAEAATPPEGEGVSKAEQVVKRKRGRPARNDQGGKEAEEEEEAPGKVEDLEEPKALESPPGEQAQLPFAVLVTAKRKGKRAKGRGPKSKLEVEEEVQLVAEVTGGSQPEAEVNEQGAEDATAVDAPEVTALMETDEPVAIEPTLDEPTLENGVEPTLGNPEKGPEQALSQDAFYDAAEELPGGALKVEGSGAENDFHNLEIEIVEEVPEGHPEAEEGSSVPPPGAQAQAAKVQMREENESDSFSSLFKEEDDAEVDGDEVNGPSAPLAPSANGITDTPEASEREEEPPGDDEGEPPGDDEGEPPGDDEGDEWSPGAEAQGGADWGGSQGGAKRKAAEGGPESPIQKRARLSGSVVRPEPGEQGGPKGQMQYRCHFNWRHYCRREALGSEREMMTEASPSLSRVVLKAVEVVHKAEAAAYVNDAGEPRNVLDELSKKTRQTKVTLQAPTPGLKRSHVTDSSGRKYWAVLDRGKTESEQDYLLTVLRQNLTLLELCPALIKLEASTAKNSPKPGSSTLTPVGTCTCQSPTEEGPSVAEAPTGVKRSRSRSRQLNEEDPPDWEEDLGVGGGERGYRIQGGNGKGTKGKSRSRAKPKVPPGKGGGRSQQNVGGGSLLPKVKKPPPVTEEEEGWPGEAEVEGGLATAAEEEDKGEGDREDKEGTREGGQFWGEIRDHIKSRELKGLGGDVLTSTRRSRKR